MSGLRYRPAGLVVGLLRDGVPADRVAVHPPCAPVAAAQDASMTVPRSSLVLPVLLSWALCTSLEGPVCAGGSSWRRSSAERLLWKGETNHHVFAGTRLANQELMVGICVKADERAAAEGWRCEFWRGFSDLERIADVIVPDFMPYPPVLVASAFDSRKAALVYMRVRSKTEHELGILWITSERQPFAEPVAIPSGHALEFDAASDIDGGFYLAWSDPTDEQFTFANFRYENRFKIYVKRIAGVGIGGEVMKACFDGKCDCMVPRIRAYQDGVGILYAVHRYGKGRDAVRFLYPDGRERELRKSMRIPGTCGFAPEADGSISAAWEHSWSEGTGGKLEWIWFGEEDEEEMLVEYDRVQSCEGPFVVDELGRYLVFMRRPEASVFVEEGDLMIAFSRFGGGRADVERLAVGDGLRTYDVIPSATGSLDVVVARQVGTTREVGVQQFTLGTPRGDGRGMKGARGGNKEPGSGDR